MKYLHIQNFLLKLKWLFLQIFLLVAICTYVHSVCCVGTGLIFNKYTCKIFDGYINSNIEFLIFME